jgi:lipopolysaccharide assembly outer membrane protein LptD (OstA)
LSTGIYNTKIVLKLQRFFLKVFFFLVYLLITAINCTAHTIHSERKGSLYSSSIPLIIAGTFAELLETPLKKAFYSITTDTVIAPVQNNSALKEKITYNATDSMVFDMINQKVYLYNNAVVVYEDVKLEAGYIELDFGKNILYSRGIPDSAGNIVQKPVSTQAGEKFNAGEISYNFKTKKGKIKDVITQQGDGYIHGRSIKKDSSDVYYVADGKYTTCDLDHPHYYIEAKKIKVIQNDKIVTGPAELYLADVPTPLVLPFGYFPNKKGRASGILIPTYGESNQWGFFLKDGGFYFGTNEYVDLALRGDIYANGSFGVAASSNYNNRYHYNGLLNFKYSQIIDGDRELPNAVRNNVFSLQWNHVQDPKARPDRRFSANVNAGSSSFNKYNGSVTGSYLTNTMQSNISFSKSFTGTPFNFSANARHSQNTITKKVDLSLPELALTMSRIYPFKNNSRVGNKWYDKVGVSMSANARNEIHTYDSLLFTNTTVNRMQNGIEIRVPITTSLNVFKYFTFSPTIATRSVIYRQSIIQYYDPESKKAVIDTLTGMKVANDYSIQGALNTRLYGDYFFRTKRLKQIRHVATPSITASYRPDFSENQYGYYHTVQTDSTGSTKQYSVFQNGIYGSPAAGPSGLVSFGLNNTLEAKVRQKTDSGSVDKKVSLIDNFSGSISYNVAAKKFKWSSIGLNGRTKLFKKLDVNTIVSLDPYQLDSLGQRVERFEWNNKRIGRLTSATLSLGASLRGQDKTSTSSSGATAPKPNGTPYDYNYIVTHPNAYVDFNIPWNVNAYYNLNYTKPGKTAQTTQTITFNGNLFLTKNWEAGVTSGYDFTNKRVTVTSINVHRNLHCWEMNFTWVPFGFRQSFMLNINVKSAMLKDLKLTRKKDWYDYK